MCTQRRKHNNFDANSRKLVSFRPWQHGAHLVVFSSSRLRWVDESRQTYAQTQRSIEMANESRPALTRRQGMPTSLYAMHDVVVCILFSCPLRHSPESGARLHSSMTENPNFSFLPSFPFFLYCLLHFALFSSSYSQREHFGAVFLSTLPLSSLLRRQWHVNERYH